MTLRFALKKKRERFFTVSFRVGAFEVVIVLAETYSASFVHYDTSADGSRKRLVPNGILCWIQFMCLSLLWGPSFTAYYTVRKIYSMDVSSWFLQRPARGPELNRTGRGAPGAYLRAVAAFNPLNVICYDLFVKVRALCSHNDGFSFKLRSDNVTKASRCKAGGQAKS